MQHEPGLSPLSPHPPYITIATMLKDIADARIPWVTDVLVGSIATTNWVDCPPSLSSHHRVLLNTPACLSLVSEVFLKEAFISDVSKKIVSTIGESLFKQPGRILFVSTTHSHST